MTEPSTGDRIAFNHALITSLTFALIAAGILTPSELAAACRKSAEGMESDRARSDLLAFAKKWEEAEAVVERQLVAGQTPEQTADAPDRDVLDDAR